MYRVRDFRSKHTKEKYNGYLEKPIINGEELTCYSSNATFAVHFFQKHLQFFSLRTFQRLNGRQVKPSGLSTWLLLPTIIRSKRSREREVGSNNGTCFCVPGQLNVSLCNERRSSGHWVCISGEPRGFPRSRETRAAPLGNLSPAVSKPVYKDFFFFSRIGSSVFRPADARVMLNTGTAAVERSTTRSFSAMKYILMKFSQTEYISHRRDSACFAHSREYEDNQKTIILSLQ